MTTAATELKNIPMIRMRFVVEPSEDGGVPPELCSFIEKVGSYSKVFTQDGK